MGKLLVECNFMLRYSTSGEKVAHTQKLVKVVSFISFMPVVTSLTARSCNHNVVTYRNYAEASEIIPTHNFHWLDM